MIGIRPLAVTLTGLLTLTVVGACTGSRDRGYYDRGSSNDRGYVERDPVPVSRGGDWELLGRASVDSRSRADHDVIPIGKSAGRFKRLDFRVDGGDIELYNVRVVYDNGEVKDTNLRKLFDSRGRQHTIDLTGDERHLRRVEFSYRAVVGRPVVSLFGR